MALPAFGCEQQRSYTFPMHCKRSLNPTLTHQFEVTWPWPALQRKRRSRVASGTGNAQVVVSSSNTPQGVLFKEEDEAEEGEDDEGEVPEEGTGKEGVPGSDASAAVCSSVSPLWRERRRYGRPTFILDLSSDPFLGGHETRRASVLLSPGHRCLLPLVELGEPAQLPDRAGVAFWRTAFKPPSRRAESLSSSSHPSAAYQPPYCAELVVGELPRIERAVRQRRERAIASPRRNKTHASMRPSFLSRILLEPLTQLSAPPPTAGEEENLPAESPGRPSPCAKPEKETAPASSVTSATEHGHGQIAAASSPPAASSRSQRGSAFAPTPVLTFFFYTIPFRLRWLSQLPGCIVVSLPCEERLLTLHAPHANGDHSGARQPSPSLVRGGGSTTPTAIIAMSEVHSYALPRGVVPLDISEVFDRPFLAIGTAEHGVLLCHLDTSTGAVQSIARWISLRGYGSSLYPVTRLAAVFPARQPERAPGCFTDFPAAPPWARHAADLESLNDGALVCSSPYEATTAVVKLGVAAEGVVEDFSVLRGVDTILDVSATVQPDLGPLVCTVARKLLRLRVVDSAAEAAERRTAILKKKLDSGLADRVSPCLTYDRMARLECPVLHVASSPAVVQSFTEKYVSRRSYTKHWQFAVDSSNRVALLDRTVSQYIVHSTFQLCRRGSAAGEGRVAPASSLLPVSITADRRNERRAKSPCAGEEEDVLGNGCEAAAEDNEDNMPLPSPPSTRLSPTPVGGQKRPRPAPKTSRSKRRSEPAAKRRGAAAVPSSAGAAGAKEERDEDEDDGEDDASPGKVNSFHAFASAIPIEDACSGVVVTRVQDQMIQVAAAHDRDCISLVTWRIGLVTPPPSPMSSAAATTITEASAACGMADAQP
ncbi:conserved hypothetical protein [Leishmania major strain Friedlin]|uniref:Uncharacterized protein n=1 Tax=Leishmania major TaxID=5664 RepID=Q4QIJ0_LEIMA|nr:conserved hypothetical protein [Leishmania major strain Friedlin]CAJ07063.1 conserved hypothetical protein [Leishmania major strain Friedlin]|eukprot:XP_001681008.1 conserved hypothetical protein [Leishmania major strain Friedlin]